MLQDNNGSFTYIVWRKARLVCIRNKGR